MRLLSLIPLVVVSVVATPLDERAAAPTVKVSSGNIVGKTSSSIDTFNGVPFAQPPVGQLRLKPPQPYTAKYPSGTFNAAGSAKACLQGLIGGPDISKLPAAAQSLIPSFVDTVSQSSEDCLTLNVQRPAGTKAGANLPVVFWIYGGGFAAGSSNMYDGSDLIKDGVATGHGFIFVAVNYRLSAFGFLAGKELQNEGSTNLGLRDQRLGLQWVADNIAAFGGDPSKVTIWGESAGSISVCDHMVINNGDNTYNGQPLFRAAIMNSGTIVPSDPVDTPKAQNVFNTFAAAAGCGSASNKLSCLRGISAYNFQQAATTLPGLFSYRALDLAYLPRPDPADSFFSTSAEVAFYNSQFAKVPVIAGDQEDEGTLFSLVQSNITTSAKLVQYLQSYFPVSGYQYIPQLVAAYPDDITAGSPFRTSIFNNIYGQYKRLAAILGDITFTLLRRAFLEQVTRSVPAWSFLDTHLYGTPVLGTLHGNDIVSIFFGLSLPNVKNTYRTAVTSFAYYQDPNKISNLNWAPWTNDTRAILNIGNLNNKADVDNFRTAQYNVLKSFYGLIRV